MPNFKINIKVETPEKLPLEDKMNVLHDIRKKLAELSYDTLELNFIVTKEVTNEELLDSLKSSS